MVQQYKILKIKSQYISLIKGNCLANCLTNKGVKPVVSTADVGMEWGNIGTPYYKMEIIGRIPFTATSKLWI